jgi:hypothetical protein
VLAVRELARGSLLGDIAASIDSGNTTDYLNYVSKLTDAVKERLGKFSAADIPSIVGIDKAFVEREAKIIQTIVSGEALGNHMEDQYYFGIGRACGKCQHVLILSYHRHSSFIHHLL